MKEIIPRLKIYHWDYFFFISGSMGEVPSHGHNAVQIFINEAGNHAIQIGESVIDDPVVIVDRNVSHAVLSSGENQFSILIDGDSDAAGHISHRFISGATYSSDPELLQYLDLESPSAVKDQLNDLLKAEDCPICTPKDPRIIKIKELIDNDEEKKPSLLWLCDQVGLSDSRLAHLFKEEIGIPLRKYLLWKRLISALEIILQGHNLTYAAYESGFSDSAHLSRTFKSNFGFNLSKIFKNSRFIQFHSL